VVYDNFPYYTPMPPERKTVMVSVRLPASLVGRADFVVKNTDGDIRNRSVALQAALEAWLPGQEQLLEKKLGTALYVAPSKKVR
jgi:Arc/MetJ-type ribon-helix-helix transcriptional regulator